MNTDIVELTKTTAQNMYELMLALAQRIESLEKENADLKEKLKNESK
jgi:uncharacterized protein (UPF0335 family)